MKRRGTPTVTLRLAANVRDQLEALAQERGVSLSDIIREALLDFLWRLKQNE